MFISLEKSPLDIDPRIVTLRIVFDSENTRFDSPRRTTILTPTTMWEIVRRNGKRFYYFSTKPQSYHEHMDPRRFLTWVDKEATYLREHNVYIKGREVFNGTLCYVLEAKQEDRSKRIWIAPERGFRHLKYEIQQPTPVDALDFEALLAAIKQTNTPLKSGEGVVVHISGEPPLDIDPRIVTLRIVFDSENTRFDSPRRTTILTPTTMWEIVRRNGKPDYALARNLMFSKITARPTHKWIQDDSSLG